VSREIRKRRNYLLLKSKDLRKRANNCKHIKKSIELRALQTDTYNLWKFYDGIIKAFDNIKGCC
jgi:hypothetical protein